MEAFSSSKMQQPIREKPTDEDAPNKPPQNLVTCAHRAKIAGLYRTTTLTWTKSFMKYNLFITVENTSEENNPYTFKIEVNTWQFWAKKGLKSFKVDEKRLDVFWDLRSAKFSSSLEPATDYYVALVSEGEVVLLLGDQKKEAIKRVKSKSKALLVDSRLLYKKENVIGKKCFDARSLLGNGKKEHEIHIETSFSVNYDPQMWIVIDGTVVVQVTNLHWRFRGNETIIVDDMRVQIFWDVYDWLFKGSCSGKGMFIFGQGGGGCERDNNGGAICDECSKDFCHIVYAWKVE